MLLSDLGCYLIIYKTCSKSERPWGESMTSASWLICFFPTESLIGIAINLWVILEILTLRFSFWVQFSSVAQSCPTLCDPMNHSTPGLPVHHQLPEFTQTHTHRVSDAIQPSHSLSSPSPPAPNPSQHQSLFPMSQLFAGGGQSTGVSALASFLPKKSQG